MNRSKFQLTLGLALAFAITISLAVSAQAQLKQLAELTDSDSDGYSDDFGGATAAAQPGAATEKTVLNFPASGALGNTPGFGLISDAAGNLYGVTTDGGFGYGSVYELSPTGNGGWTATSLYLFQPGEDGHYPVGGLVRDSSGNLYGTTEEGGSNLFCTNDWDVLPCGTVFELSPNGSGGWSEKILFNFSQKDGYWPISSLIMDAAGNLYGTTPGGGEFGGGTAYELQRNGENWTETVLHSFGGAGDGSNTLNPLLLDASGNLYGAATQGGSGGGLVFKLLETDGGWREDILFEFTASATSPFAPDSGLIFGKGGSLYGILLDWNGTISGLGSVFELSPTSGGSWKETVLYTFANKTDGDGPWGNLAFDSAGNLYGITTNGGSKGLGNVFELTPSASGAWTETVVHSFQGSPDGATPNPGLLFSKGKLYGETSAGGSAGGGTVFEVTP